MGGTDHHQGGEWMTMPSYAQSHAPWLKTPPTPNTPSSDVFQDAEEEDEGQQQQQHVQQQQQSNE